MNVKYFVVNNGQVIRSGECPEKLLEAQAINAGDRVVKGDPPPHDFTVKESYTLKRQREYPSIADQLDTLYHKGFDAWKATIDQVKRKYPKPV